jgi:hypothetical protein
MKVDAAYEMVDVDIGRYRKEVVDVDDGGGT